MEYPILFIYCLILLYSYFYFPIYGDAPCPGLKLKPDIVLVRYAGLVRPELIEYQHKDINVRIITHHNPA